MSIDFIKAFYFKLLSSNLSQCEYELIFFAGLSKKFDDLKEAIEKTRFFSFFPKNTNETIQREWLFGHQPFDFARFNILYAKEAFKG